MLVFLMIGPLPVAQAVSIDGTHIVSENDGTITVSGTTSGARLALNAVEGGSSRTATASGSTHIFEDLQPGIYTVTETIDGVDSTSNRVEIKPKPVTLTRPDSDNRITVSNAIPGATIEIHHDETGFIPRYTTANDSGIGYFDVGYSSERVPPGKNYRANQTVNGATSNFSNSIDIAPGAVRLTVTIEGAGANNNSGAIEVNDTRKGNRLYLHQVNSNRQPVIRTVENADSYTFTGLSAGTYYVIQEERGAESIRSNEVSIIDEMPPTIQLVGPSEETVYMPKDYQNWEYTIQESDVVADDNISDPKVSWTVSPDRTINKPGVYTITYTAEDDAGNKSSVQKKVTVAPPTLDILEVFNTRQDNEDPPGRSTGDVTVDNVMANATLKVYKDPDGESIKTIVRANDSSQGTFTISDIDVGKDYYVTQIVDGIESDTSSRFDIKDNTKPIIQLINSKTVEFIRGGQYVEYGATAIDNVDDDNDITSRIVIDSSDVNMDVPGKYTVTYNVTDNAGNHADEVTRTVIVKPHAVTAIGSDADIGEVGVKDAYPGAVLKLYNVNDTENPVAVSRPLAANATTYVFKNRTDLDGNAIDPDKGIPPGSYFVVQEFSVQGGEMLESMRSNIVDVRDTDRPYITINGLENLFFTWDESLEEYEYNGEHGIFKDPGAFAEDYLDNNDELTNDIKRKIFYNGKEICNDSDSTLPNCKTDVKIEFPGVYEIAYNVTAERGTKADEKRRKITVAPPAVGELKTDSKNSKITVSDTFFHNEIETTVNLYNRHGELIQSLLSDADQTVVFEEIPAGLGYYVTQTVNNVASTPSDPVNLTLHEDADGVALMNSFSIVYEGGKQAVGTIDHEDGEIFVTLPKSADLKKLTAVFKATGKVTVNHEEQTSGSGTQSFENDVRYTVTPEKGEPKVYTVKVTNQSFETEAWTNTVSKRVSFTAAGSMTTLSPAEIREAQKVGVSFVGDDRAVHVPAANVKETSSPSITLKKDAFQARETDPTWAKNVEYATEIRFGNGPLMNPIEFEIEHKQDKQLARIVRDGSNVYAIVQPTQRQGTQLIGLVTEPGIYAFIDGVNSPTIEQTSPGKYSLTANSGGTIYYTTSSQTVDFEKSARNANLNSYRLSEFTTPTDDWKEYRPGQTIQTNKEIYAYEMKNSIMSPVEGHIQTQKKEWSRPVTKPISHSFTITFNAPADKKILYNDLIYVIDDATGKKVDVTLQLSKDRKKVTVSPKKAYKRGNQYTLHIEQQIKGQTKNNEFLQEALTQTFITK